MNYDIDKIIEDARALGIEVNENSDTPGIYYIDDNGERVKWDYESEFREISIGRQENNELLNRTLRFSQKREAKFNGNDNTLLEKTGKRRR